jgi:LacI family transcriptional regulator
MTRRATVTDVARLARVGGSTVSRYLRGIAVRPEIAERVSRAIRELGYEPDQTARALRIGRTHTVGVILPKVSNVFFSQVVQLIEEEIRNCGCTVILLTHQDRMAQQAEHLSTLRRYKVDGVIMTAAPGTTLKDVRACLPDVPMVALDALFSSEVDSVLLRNRDSARTAAEHLLGHGYRNVACVIAKPGIYSYQERAGGYSDAMARHNLAGNLITAPDYDKLRFALDAAMQGRSRPAALLSLSDLGTLNVLRAFDELGMKPSERLPLVGFDDFDFAPLIDPPLTVIRQPIEKMVRYALNLLFRRIDGLAPNGAQVISLPGELICRRSCGCL